MEKVGRMKYNSYTTDFKQSLVKLAQTTSTGKVAKKYKVPIQTLRYWIEASHKPKFTNTATNARILIISDTQFPFEHPLTFQFLEGLHAQYDFTRVIQIGDFIDNYRGSRYDQCPDMPSAADELHAARLKCQRLQRLFPYMDLIIGNHDVRYLKKAKGVGIPKGAMVDFQTLLQLEDGWNFHHELILEMPTGDKVMFHHGKSSNVRNNAIAQGINFVQGHHHTKFVVDYIQQRDRQLFGMTTGCLIDDSKEPFGYNDTNKELPILGCAGIIEGLPILFPMRVL